MNYLKQCLIYLIVCGVILGMLMAIAEIAQSKITINVAEAEEYKVEFIMPELKVICAAESTGNWLAEPRHWDSNGSVLRGRVVPDDIGQCQINERIWGKKAKELGFNLYSFNGNRQMANWIYTKYGSKPWYLSRSMWDK